MRRRGIWFRQACGEAIDGDALPDQLCLAVKVGEGGIGIAGVVVFVVLDQVLLDGVANLGFGDDLQGEEGHAEVGGIPAEAVFAWAFCEGGGEGCGQQTPQPFGEVERHKFLQVLIRVEAMYRTRLKT